jgi:two-component system, NtrC family, nitrogen regulation sensor histidine kinase NtrY
LKGRLSLLLLVSIFFLGAGLITHYFSLKKTSEDALAQKIADNLEKELKKVEDDFSLVSNDLDQVDPGNLCYPLFLYHKNTLDHWTDNTFVPSLQQVSDTFTTKLVSTGSESYLLRKKVLGNRGILISVIKLVRNYPINNDYFSSEYNADILPSADVKIMDANSTAGHPVCIGNECYFRVDFLAKNIVVDKTTRIITFCLLSISLLTFILFIFRITPLVSKQYSEVGFLFLLFVFVLLRLLLSYTGFPGNLISSPLFDPQAFAVSALNASLGDLFINLLAAAALSFYIFRNYFRFHIQKLKTHPAFSWVIGVLSGLFILFAWLFPFVVIQTLYNNSAIVIDISQSLQFDMVRITAMCSVLISGICAFLFSHAFIRTLVAVGSRSKVIVCFLISVVIFSLINELTLQKYMVPLIISFVYFFVVYLLGLYNRLKQLNFGTFGYLFVAIFFLSINGAYAIQFFTQKEKIENQFRFASNFLIDRDYFAEYLLDDASGKIARDAFIQTRIASPFLGKEAIRQKIRQIFLPSYFNKYDVDIFIFNGVGDPVDHGLLSLSDFLAIYDRDAYKTQYEGIRFIDNPAADVAQRYLVITPIVRSGITTAHIIIQLSLKKIIPENVYPELLVDYSYQQFYRTEDLSYAVYSNKHLLFTSGEFNYERFFDPLLFGDPALYTKSLSFSGFDHIAVEDPGTRVAIVSARKIPFIYKLSNFSFLLSLGLFIILIMIFGQGIYQYFRGSRLFFSARIQLYLYLAFFIPLIIVSISTLSLTSRSSQQQLNDEYLNKSKIFGEQITDYLEEDSLGRDPDNISLENRLTDLAQLSSLDANIYDPGGILRASSQSLIFERNLLSAYINPRALSRILGGENHFVESENVGRLNYFVSYAVLKSPQSGKMIGILGIPFFQSARLLEKIQSVILINILNIFAFILIILLLLSYVVAERLTFPLRFITQSLRRTSLTRINTPLTWPTEDEIGFMVKEYNGMLHKLAESKNELEQTQREKAWREIAQQVAHEIKNPLTPMKLTLQQLERALQSGNSSIEKTEKAVATLLGQVDTLNEIASSFSGFVKMPELVIQKLDVVAIVKRSVDLHSPTGEIQFRPMMKEAWILGDAQLLSRTFSNIILNALQAAKPGQSISVQISVGHVNGMCRITFRDNGKGIEPLIADRVFLPHFSTKKSGSGLGLAIARQGIEQMKGKIWFETTPGAGTSFFIELPLV